MREIKFRAWVKPLMKMAEVNGWLKGTVFLSADSGEGSRDMTDIELMQFTGLKDKNGVEIYEGDIVKLLQRDWPSQLDSYPELSHEQYLDMLALRLVVSFKRGSFVMAHSIDDEAYYQTFDYGGYKDIFEVVGNIYENPELLATKGKTE